MSQCSKDFITRLKEDPRTKFTEEQYQTISDKFEIMEREWFAEFLMEGIKEINKRSYAYMSKKLE
jgi:hypothetical protein